MIPIIRPDTYLIFVTLYSPETTLWYLLNININVKKTEKKILTKGGLLTIFFSSIFFTYVVIVLSVQLQYNNLNILIGSVKYPCSAL